MGLDDIVDWFSEVGNSISDFFSNLFDGVGGISSYGAIFGMIGILFLLFAGKWTLAPFLQHQGAVGKVFWTIATYLGTFIACYFMGRHFENT